MMRPEIVEVRFRKIEKRLNRLIGGLAKLEARINTLEEVRG